MDPPTSASDKGPYVSYRLALDGDALQVVALADDGPGKRAGLAVGDRLTRIDGEPTSARTLAAWRERFGELPSEPG